MARINGIFPYNGASMKAERLGLQPIVNEIQDLLMATEIRLFEEKQENGAAAVRQLLDHSFAGTGTWEKKTTGDIDWRKCKVVNGTSVCVGLEIQVSARSELLYKDILHLRTRIVGGNIDLGIIVVPSDRMQSFLPDRTPSISYARRVVAETDADRLPIILIEIEHDGPGPRLGKKRTNLSERGGV
jgi:hypothetical protein